MIEEKDRLSLIEYRLKQAGDTIQLANFLADSQSMLLQLTGYIMGCIMP